MNGAPPIDSARSFSCRRRWEGHHVKGGLLSKVKAERRCALEWDGVIRIASSRSISNECKLFLTCRVLCVFIDKIYTLRHIFTTASWFGVALSTFNGIFPYYRRRYLVLGKHVRGKILVNKHENFILTMFSITVEISLLV